VYQLQECMEEEKQNKTQLKTPRDITETSTKRRHGVKILRKKGKSFWLLSVMGKLHNMKWIKLIIILNFNMS